MVGRARGDNAQFFDGSAVHAHRRERLRFFVAVRLRHGTSVGDHGGKRVCFIGKPRPLRYLPLDRDVIPTSVEGPKQSLSLTLWQVRTALPGADPATARSCATAPRRRGKWDDAPARRSGWKQPAPFPKTAGSLPRTAGHNS